MLITLFKNLLLPPAFQFLVILLSVMLWRRWRRIAQGLMALALLSLYLLTLPAISSKLFIWLEKPYIQSEIEDQLEAAEVIVILGGGRTRNGTVDGQDILSGSSLSRLFYGVSLANQYQLPVIVSGGRVFPGDSISEAELAQYTLANLGSSVQIIAEGNSRNTWENARNTSELLTKREIQKVVLVTDAYHMRRSVLAFERFGVEVMPVPIGLKAQNLTHTIADWIPSAGAMLGAKVALHEYIGLVFYLLR